VIAAVNGYAIGGGHVLHLLCDLTIAAEEARFGQTGPRVGSFDAGFGTAYMARVVGEKRAREVWFLCRQYDAETAERWGLVNRVVPATDLRAEVRRWADEILALSPTALRFLKQSFNADSEHIVGLGQPPSAAWVYSRTRRRRTRASARSTRSETPTFPPTERVHPRDRTALVASVYGIHPFPNDLDVLLRHRPLSIARRCAPVGGRKETGQYPARPAASGPPALSAVIGPSSFR
jgi:hypothetical protein